MDREESASHDVGHPSIIIIKGMLHCVAAINEEQAQRRAPPRGDIPRLTHNRDHGPFQASFAYGFPEKRERINSICLCVPNVGIEVLPARLILFRAAMVIDREQQLAGVRTSRAHIDCGLAAISADFETRPVRRSLQSSGLKRKAFLMIKEAFYVGRI